MNRFQNLSALLGCLVLTGCVEETFDLRPDGLVASGAWSPAFAIPVGEVVVTAEEALVWLDSAGISSEVTGSGGLAIYETFEIVDTTANHWLSVADQTWSQDIIIPTDVPPGTALEVPLNIDFALPNGLVLDSLSVAVGSLGVETSGDVPVDLLLQVAIEEWTVAGVPFAFGVGSGAEDIGLSGVTWTEDGNAGLGMNLSLESSASGFSAGDVISISMSFGLNPIDWVVGSWASGTFGNFDQSLALSALDGLEPGVVHVSAPRLELEATNGVGLSIQPVISSASYATAVGEAVIAGDQITNIPPIPAATNLMNVMPGEWSHVLNNDGTTPTLTAILESSPASMTLSGHLTTSGTGGSGFVTADAPIRVVGRLVLPLEGWLSDYAFRDTMALDLDQIFSENFENRLSWEDVSSITLRALWQNDLPVAVRPELNFQDSMRNVLATWYEGSDAFTFVPAGASEVVDWTISREELATLQPLGIRHLAWAATLSTPNAVGEEDVFIPADAALKLRLGLAIQIDANLNEE